VRLFAAVGDFADRAPDLLQAVILDDQKAALHESCIRHLQN
jgi:hypothetical protein